MDDADEAREDENPDDALDPRSAGALLAVLLAVVNDRGDATALLDERVVLYRLDGAELQGRAAVLDAIVTRGTEATLRVTAVYSERIHVALHVTGVPGHLPFTMTARVVAGVLREIRMAHVEPR
jgi:hypothetical protein